MMSILRQVEVKDYAPIIQVIDDWWGGHHTEFWIFGTFRATSCRLQNRLA